MQNINELKIIQVAKSKAIKEFAKRLTKKWFYAEKPQTYTFYGKVVSVEDVDNLVKEMTEEKTMTEIKVKQFDVEETVITILSYEETKRVPKKILANGEYWWLGSPFAYDSYSAGIVDTSGNVSWNYHTKTSGARPAFRIANLQSEVGEKVLVENTWCTCVFDNVVLADKCICERRFDGDSNDWETSELKAFIESDEFKAML